MPRNPLTDGVQIASWVAVRGEEEGPINGEEKAAREAHRQRRAEALAQRVRALRGWGDYTLDQLSERSGLSRQYLSDLERGKRPRPRSWPGLQPPGPPLLTPGPSGDRTPAAGEW